MTERRRCPQCDGNRETEFWENILITELELKSRDYVVLAKQEHQALLDHRDEVLERTDVPF